MPYPNEHSARVRDPGDFEEGSFRSKTLPKSEGGTGGVRMIMGHLKGETTMTVQAYRFPADLYTPEEAKQWLEDNDVKYISFEKAKEANKGDLAYERLEIQARNAFSNQFPRQSYPQPSIDYWILETYDDHVVVNYGQEYFEVFYTMEGDQIVFDTSDKWVPVEEKKEWIEKAAKLKQQIAVSSVKAVGDWELEVLAVPFGSKDNTDSDKQWFDANTNILPEQCNNPVVTYYHGLDPENKPLDEPEIVGNVISGTLTKKSDGWWIKVALDKASEYAKRIWEAAKNGLAKASSGTIDYLARLEKNGKNIPYNKKTPGRIAVWPLGELALFDTGKYRQPANQFAVALPVMKSVYARAGKTMPDLPDDGDPQAKAKGDKKQRASAGAAGDPASNLNKELDMDPQEIQTMMDEAVAKALKSRDDAEAKVKFDAKTKQDEIDVALKKQKEDLEKEWAKKHRLPFGADDAPYIAKFGEISKYDDLDADDQAFMVGVLGAAKANGHSKKGATESAIKALALKIIESKDDDKYGAAKAAMMREGIPLDALKSNDFNYSTYSGYGDQWVVTSYSTRLWDKIRLGTPVVGNIPTVIVPQGAESITIQLMGTSPTFYKVAQASAMGANPGATTNVFTVSKPTTPTPQTLSVGKLGAAITFTGELEEDSVIPWATSMRTDMEKEGQEVLESLVIDGDTEAGASANINNIASTPGTTDYFVILDGFRKLALVTNTAANSRAGGALTVEDFLETVKLMGLAGKNAVQKDQVAFIIDLWTAWKALELPEVKTKDAFSAPTIENGVLTALWGYKVIASANMHRPSTDTTYGLKANSAGKIDQGTAANNAYGAILAVRWDQWLMGMKRNWLFETQRVPRADVTEITASTRVGLTYRDTDASAESYGVVV